MEFSGWLAYDLKDMSDTIEEIQSKKRREAGLDAWAEMLERIHNRQMQPATVTEEGGVGGAGLPRDTVLRQDPRLAQDRQLKLQAIKTEMANLQAEARRTQDVVNVKQVEKAEKAQDEAKAKAPEAVKQAHAPVETAPVHEVKREEEVQAQVAVEAQVLEAEAPVLSNTVEGAEKFVQLASMTGLQQDSVVAATAEPEEESPATSIEEVMQLMALKNGAGANPELAAKEYVLASELPGVKDTLNGGVFEDFRVAL